MSIRSQMNFAGRRQAEPSFQASSRPPAFAPRRPSELRDDQIDRETPRLGRRMFRGFVRFVIAVLIGVGGTLGWQSYGEQAVQMVGTLSPELARLLPVPAKSQAAAASDTLLQQQMEPLGRELAAMRRSVEQMSKNQALLAAQQDRMAQNILAVQSSGQDLQQKIQEIGEKISAPPPAPARPARAAPRKPAEPMPLSAR